jgi:hypothetical protein
MPLLLPYEILIHIYEYNPEHRKQMYWVLRDIQNIQNCQVCDKIIIKYTYSLRRCNMVCCSIECVDNCYSEVI